MHRKQRDIFILMQRIDDGAFIQLQRHRNLSIIMFMKILYPCFDSLRCILDDPENTVRLINDLNTNIVFFVGPVEPY